MNSAVRQLAVENLKTRGLRPSEQRILVYGYLWEHRIHPCADTIYRALQPEHPTLSRTTVYNTLNLLAEHGLVQSLTIEDGELRYDANTDFHAHFKCRVCGGVTDIFPPEHMSPLPRPETGFQVDEIHLDYYGKCAGCAAKLQ